MWTRAPFRMQLPRRLRPASCCPISGPPQVTAPILSPWSLVLGAVAHGALIGALDGVRFELPTQVLAVHLIFTTDAHITALTFELFKDSDERGRIWEAVIGMAAVAMALTAYSALLNRQAHEGPRSKR